MGKQGQGAAHPSARVQQKDLLRGALPQRGDI